MKTVISSFEIQPDRTRAGVTLFGGDGAVEIGLSDFTTLDSLVTGINELKPIGDGRSRIDSALDVTYNKLFSAQSNGRNNIHKSIVIITGSEQSNEVDAKPLQEAIENFQEYGFQVR